MLLVDWLAAPRADRGIYVADSSNGWTYRPYTEFAAAAGAVASRLRDSQVESGTAVILLFARQADFAAAFFGVLGAGCTPAPVAPPTAFGNGARYTEYLTTLMRRSGCSAVLTDDHKTHFADAAAAACQPAPSVIRVNVDNLDTADRPAEAPVPDLALLQFTSGSSGTPKGVRVTKDNLCANLTAIHEWIRMSEDDSSALWLPHYHDMGLMSLLRGVVSQLTLWLMTPQQFIRDPLRWLRCIGENKATITGGPPFGYAYTARRVTPDQLAGMDFSAWRAAILGAERIDPAAVAEFVRRVEPFGFRRTALLPAYGMAEATLIVTGAAAGAESVVRELESPAVRMGEAVKFGASGILGVDQPHGGTWLTGCGFPVSGTQIEVIDERGSPLPDGYLGEIRIRGTSVAAGYHSSDSDERFTDHGLRTGDSGVIVDGDLFVVGRIGDSLKVRGAAVHAEDLELEIARELELIPNQVAVLLGTLELADLAMVIVQSQLDDALISRTAALVLGRTAESVAIGIVQGTSVAIKRTSSGKPRRRVMWQAIVNGELPGELVYTTWHDGARPAAPWETQTTAQPDGDAA